MYGLLNLGGLLFGLVAWLFPIVNLAIVNKTENKNWVVFSIASVSACAVSLCMQLLYNSYLVRIKDWSALMDTAKPVVYVSLVLLVVIITLNTITVVVYRKNSVK